jgi:hypothetical protein
VDFFMPIISNIVYNIFQLKYFFNNKLSGVRVS